VKTNEIKSLLKRRIFTLIRVLLIVSVIANIAITAIFILTDQDITKDEILSEITKRIEFVFWGIVTFILTFGTSYVRQRNKVYLPEILEISIIVFIFAAIYLSVRYNLYYRFFWWDNLLHGLSGIIIGFIGFIMIYKLNHRYSMDISPLLVAVFSFSFAVTLGVFWEIFEFTSDAVLGTATQKWDLPSTARLLGQEYQGSGLRDTMSDLILNCLGALITSVIAYYLYKNEKTKILNEMKKIVPGEQHG